MSTHLLQHEPVLASLSIQIAPGAFLVPSLDTVNAFIEDTCVLATIAYTIGRGPLLALLYDSPPSRQRTLWLGGVLGLLASTEALFPGARAPYVASGAMISLAAVAGDLPICALTTLLALAAFALHGFLGPLLPTVACFAGSISARGILGRANVYLRGFGSAFVGQGFAVGVRALMGTYRTESLASAPANALGVLVILVILNDARIRARSEQNKLEAERTQTLVREAQLQDLRARIHPHFMFNTLTSIAALCRLDSVKAERSVVALAAILRRALETPGTDQLPLSQEIEHVKNYLEIEQVRWGEKLKIVWRLDESALLDRAPAFCLQTLVENAIIHGGKKVDTLQVRISVFQRGERTRVSVKDNGPGFQETPDLEDSSPVHGLPITNRRLTMIAEQKARLRVFSKAGSGSLVSFSIPHAHEH